jgi:copper chaperone CopZ
VKITLRISGMSCQNCVHHVTDALKAVNGVTDVVLDLVSGNAVVEHTGVRTDLLIKAVNDAGYEAKIKP